MGGRIFVHGFDGLWEPDYDNWLNGEGAIGGWWRSSLVDPEPVYVPNEDMPEELLAALYADVDRATAFFKAINEKFGTGANRS